MFNRKVLFVALLAVVLLGSSVDGGVEAAGRHLNGRWAITQAGIKPEEVNDVILGCAALPSALDKIASGILAAHPTNLQAGRGGSKPHRRTAMDASSSTEIAGYAKTLG